MDRYITNQGDFDVAYEAGSIRVHYWYLGRIKLGWFHLDKFWAFPVAESWVEDSLIDFWQDGTVPACVKNAVERLYSRLNKES